MKRMMAVMMLLALVAGCRHAGPKATSRQAYLRRHIVGTWYSGDAWMGAPFSLVTFSADGQFTRSSTNGPPAIFPKGYWRVGHTGAVTLTAQRDSPPVAAFEVFRVQRLTRHTMLFTNLGENFSIAFTR
jgi:hypothetical protein